MPLGATSVGWFSHDMRRNVYANAKADQYGKNFVLRWSMSLSAAHTESIRAACQLTKTALRVREAWRTMPAPFDQPSAISLCLRRGIPDDSGHGITHPR
ncbi:hypothetical protein Fuma_01751 [Fuerstiella marisgermanici]|uniref:Uncharacterized protein n=1 Tax=Fuerstiella marisgermanici TaxID=1891926 RepID=A0A1P8WDM9_9PLAN|nr:hypothetical protein Fuma_01751 [Fuerstiella marisgermanici]